MAVKSLGLNLVIGAALGNKFFSTFDTAQKKAFKLGKAIKETNTRLDASNAVINYQSKLQSLQKFQGNLGQSSDKMNRRIAATSLALEEAKRKAKSYGLNIGDIVRENNKLVQSEKRVQRQLDRARTRERNKGQRSDLRGQAVGVVGISLSLAAPLRQAIKFESVMADVKKVTNLSDIEFKKMGKSILNMSDKMPIAASGLGGIITAAGQSGIAKNQLLSFAESAAKMGIAFDISASEAGKMMADWRAGMSLTQEQTTDLADATNFLSNNLNASASAIGEVVRRQGAVAQSAGLADIETAALSAALLSSGAGPEIAATALKNLTGALTKGEAATASQKKAFSELGFNAVEMSKKMQKDAKGAILSVFKALSEAPKSKQGSLVSLLFGEESKGAVTPLLTNMDNLNKAFRLTADKTSFAGSMLKEYQVRSKTTENRMQLLSNQVTHLGVSLGSVLLPGINVVVGALGGVVNGITGAAELFPTLTKFVVGAAVGLAAFKLVALATGFAATFLSDGWLVARATFDFFSLSTIRANAALVINKAIIIGSVIQQKALAVSTGIATSAQWLWNVALNANPIGLVIAGVAGFAALAVTVYKQWEPIQTFFQNLWKSIKSVFDLSSKLGSTISDFFGGSETEKKGSRKSRRVTAVGDTFNKTKTAGARAVKSAAIGAALAAPLTALPVAASSINQPPQINNQQQYTINVTQLPGESGEELARRIQDITQETAMREEADVR